MRVKPTIIILKWKATGHDTYETARQLGIHPVTVYRWIKRARTFTGISSRKLKRKSTRPHTIHHSSLTGEQISAVVLLRKETGWTAEKLQYALKLPVAHKTIHRILKKKGLVREYGYHRRPKFQDTVHMHAKNVTTVGYLQMDVKVVTPELSGLPWTCFEYAIIDIYSRYKEAVIMNQLDQDGTITALLEMLPRLPFKPVFIQTDNGLEFQERFRAHCHALGLKTHHIHKHTPNENAVIERSFRTDEEEFYYRLEKRPQHYDELRQWLTSWLVCYNTQRPHLGLNLKTPSEVVAYVMSH